MPGTDIPIVSPDELLAATPDRMLLTLPDLLPEARSNIKSTVCWCRRFRDGGSGGSSAGDGDAGDESEPAHDVVGDIHQFGWSLVHLGGLAVGLIALVAQHHTYFVAPGGPGLPPVPQRHSVAGAREACATELFPTSSGPRRFTSREPSSAPQGKHQGGVSVDRLDRRGQGT